MSFHPKQLKILQGEALPRTHLDRYDRAANTRGIKRMLDVPCPCCLARKGEQCHAGS